MQFVDEDYEEEEPGADNPFAMSTELEKPPTGDIAAYTAQWLAQEDAEDEEVEEDSESLSGGDSDLQPPTVSPPKEDQPQFTVHTVTPTTQTDDPYQSPTVHPKELSPPSSIHSIPSESKAPTLPSNSSHIVTPTTQTDDTRQSPPTFDPKEPSPPSSIHSIPSEFKAPTLPPKSTSPFPTISPEEEMQYQASMTGRSDFSSGNFQTGRISPPPDDTEEVVDRKSDSESSSDQEQRKPMDILEDEVALEAEREKTGESPEELITRISIQCNFALNPPGKIPEKRIEKTRISIRPSDLRSVPRPIVRPQGVILSEEMRDFRAFLTRPLHPDLHLECRVIRNRSGFKRFFPVYTLTIEHPNSFLLAAKKRPKNKTSNYLISMSESDLKKNSAFYLGKLRSNFLGTEYCIYNNGLNPKKKKVTPEQYREQLGLVVYVSGMQHAKTTIAPKEVSVVIPRVDRNREREVWKPKDVWLDRNMTSCQHFTTLTKYPG